MVVGIMTGLVGMAGSLAAWSVREGRQVTLRIAAAEAVANILEEARATGFAGLNDAWALSRALPESLSSQIPGSSIKVTVETDPEDHLIKRVKATLELRTAYGGHPRTITMGTLVAARGEAKP
jgi:hypothetical protein